MRVEVETDLMRGFRPLLPEVIRRAHDHDARDDFPPEMIVRDAERHAGLARARCRHSKKVGTPMPQNLVQGPFLPRPQFNRPRL
jgi:hypothetical protein